MHLLSMLFALLLLNRGAEARHSKEAAERHERTPVTGGNGSNGDGSGNGSDDGWTGTRGEGGCVPLDEEALPGSCILLRRVCVHQDTLVTHDPEFSFTNPRRKKLPDLPYVDNWNFPAALEVNSDALRGRQTKYRLQLRQASAHEPTLALRHPVFSNCTLPVIVAAEFPFNMGEFFVRTVSELDQLELDPRVTVVLLTPQGLGLAPFHSFLMQPYSRYPLITSGDLGARGCSDPAASTAMGASGDKAGGSTELPVSWSPDASHPHCFERLVHCKWMLKDRSGSPLARVAARVVESMQEKQQLPPSTVRFDGEEDAGDPNDPGSDPRGAASLRVLIESRHGPVRNIKNVQELLDACVELDQAGFAAGPFTRLSCASIAFADPVSGGVDHKRFLANVAAVRSAHVLVVLHGAGATNGWFMRQGSSALVEVRPCMFGTKYSSWPDKYMPAQHQQNKDVIRFFALNVEDPAQCKMGDVQMGLVNKTLDKGVLTWDHSYFARDQHLHLKPDPFFEFVRHVGSLLPSLEAYREARNSELLHGYLIPEGLLYGRLGVVNVTSYRQEGNLEVIPFD